LPYFNFNESIIENIGLTMLNGYSYNITEFRKYFNKDIDNAEKMRYCG